MRSNEREMVRDLGEYGPRREVGGSEEKRREHRSDKESEPAQKVDGAKSSGEDLPLVLAVEGEEPEVWWPGADARRRLPPVLPPRGQISDHRQWLSLNPRACG